MQTVINKFTIIWLSGAIRELKKRKVIVINRVFITNDFEIPKKKLKVTLKEVSKLLGVSVDDIEFA